MPGGIPLFPVVQMKLSAYNSHFELTDALLDPVRIYDLVVVF